MSLLFRLSALLLLISLGVYFWLLFNKKKKNRRGWRLAALVTAVLMIISVFTIIFYTANADLNIQDVKASDGESVPVKKIEAAKRNFIFQDVNLFVGVMVHLIIVLSIMFAYWYMWRRAKKLPPGRHTLGYRIVLLLGMAFVAGFAVYAVYNCLTDEEYREQVYFKTYAGYFVGNLFIMLVASMVSAAGMPDEEDEEGKKELG